MDRREFVATAGSTSSGDVLASGGGAEEPVKLMPGKARELADRLGKPAGK